MQCIRAFVAQQPDELSLDKADIILVHQKSSDRKFTTSPFFIPLYIVSLYIRPSTNMLYCFFSQIG